MLASLSCIADLAAAGATSRAWRSVVASLDSRWPAVQRMALGPAAADPAVPLRWAARCLPSLTDLDLNGVPQLQPEHLAAFAHEGTPLKVSSLVFTGPPSLTDFGIERRVEPGVYESKAAYIKVSSLAVAWALQLATPLLSLLTKLVLRGEPQLQPEHQACEQGCIPPGELPCLFCWRALQLATPLFCIGH